ncbi:MAG: hypothetical protein U0R78_18360 [Nocardioidaceae bacterium]
MTNLRNAAAATAVATITCLTTLAMAGTPASGRAAHDARATTLTFVQGKSSLHLDDEPPRQGEEGKPNPGDTYFASSVLKDPTTLKKVGRSHLVCGVTHTTRTSAIALCDAALAVPGGTITATGPYSLTSSVVPLVITGGTGDFAGAIGTVTYDDSGAQSVFRVDIAG